jgi:hypothetical protein
MAKAKAKDSKAGGFLPEAQINRPLRVRHPLPIAWTCDSPPRTQVLLPALFVDSDEFHRPLARGLMVEAAIPNATATAIDHEGAAMRRAAEHAGGPDHPDPEAFFFGYSKAGQMALFERARRYLRLPSAKLQGSKTKKAKARRDQRQTRANEIWRQSGASKRKIAQQIAHEEGHDRWTWIERIIQLRPK